jgi:DNA-binding FadR family transcriptional regulator
MRRGFGGGLFVTAPNAKAVTEMAAIYLARRGMQLGEFAELRTGVEVAIANLAAERIDDAGIAGLREAFSREEHGTEGDQAEVVHDLHTAVAAAAQNRVLNW